MNIEIRLLMISQQSTEVFEGDAIAVDRRVLAWNEEVSEVEVFLHEKCDIDGSDGEEEPCTILLHLHY